MTAISRIEEVLKTEVLMEDLMVVPARGARDDEIAEEERALGMRLSPAYREFLRRWNGANLDILRFYGCGSVEEGIQPLRARQSIVPGIVVSGVVIGSDPSGFIYVEAQDGQILCVDTDGGEVESVASSFEDFILRLVFGEDADKFGDPEWKEELEEAGLL